MNLTNNGIHHGFTQFCYPHDYELSGKEFVLRSPAEAYTLEFTDQGFVKFKNKNDVVLSQYEALKLDDNTHIVFFGEYISTVVFDFKNGLATISKDTAGEYDFCTIDGFTANSGSLHGYTDEMTDTHVKWVFGCDRYIENLYQENGMCRCVWSPRDDRPRTIPAVYIRIADGIYLCELNSTSPFRTDVPQGFSKIVMLQSYERLLTVGCIYSPVLNEFRLISGYAMQPSITNPNAALGM